MDIFDSTDMHGQSRILPTIKALFSGCTLQIEQHYEDKGGVDIYITATTKSGKEVWYAIECKDRKMPQRIAEYCLELMRDVEEKILKSLDEDIKILKRANTKINEIKDHIKNFRDFSNDNTEEYKKEIDKLMEGLK